MPRSTTIPLVLVALLAKAVALSKISAKITAPWEDVETVTSGASTFSAASFSAVDDAFLTSTRHRPTWSYRLLTVVSLEDHRSFVHSVTNPIQKLGQQKNNHTVRASDQVDASRARSSMGTGVMDFLGQCLGTTAVVLLVACDDVVWLLPFVAAGEERKNTFVALYIMSMCLMWLVAFLIYKISLLVLTAHPDLPVEESVDAVSVLLLAGITLKFFYEWCHEEEEEGEENSGAVDSPGAAAERKKEASDEESRRPGTSGRRLTYNDFFLVTLAGNLDNVSVVTPLMLAGVFSPAAFLIGDFLGGCIVAMIVLGISQLRFLTDKLSGIPLWILTGLMGIWVLFNCVHSAQLVNS